VRNVSEGKKFCNHCKKYSYPRICDICGIEGEKTGELNSGYGLDWCGNCEKRHKIHECWSALQRKTKEEYISTVKAIKSFEQKASRNPESYENALKDFCGACGQDVVVREKKKELEERKKKLGMI